jgi:oligoribonuclease NrnB/cAMP/cGMP phosphodiesterase (DHH superfamily)
VDADGKCSAFMVLLKENGYPISGNGKLNANPDDFYMINYGMKFPFNIISKGEKVYIVDYSLSPEEMEQLHEITTDIIWIDHHVSAIQKLKDLPFEVVGIRNEEGIAGCMLCYIYLFCMTDEDGKVIKEFNPDMVKNAPEYVKLISDQDVWKFEYGERTKLFNLGFGLSDYNPCDTEWNTLWSNPDSVNDLIEEGKIVKRFRDRLAKDYCGSKGFECVFEDHPTFAMNIAAINNVNSSWFDSLKKSYDILMMFSYNGLKWSYSLYSDKVDVSQIATKYGGGGHKGASGFQHDELLVQAAPKKETVAEAMARFLKEM